MSIQQKLDSLQPYVISIRYLEGVAVVDAVFKTEWVIPESNNIKIVKGDTTTNYRMIFSENPNIGLDDLLEYVDSVIKLNIEREKKHELLKEKIAQLKTIFQNNSLNHLKTLEFTFQDELIPTINEIDEIPKKVLIDYIETPKTENLGELDHVVPIVNTDELSEEDLEILEEERRAENWKKMQKMGKPKINIELPPKPKNNNTCECGPEEACEKCIESKGY